MCRSRAIAPYPADEVIGPRKYTHAAIRQLVMETAVKVLRETGARAFTVVEVARVCGVARSTIYKYFGLKAGLLAACREYVGRLPSRRQRNLQIRTSDMVNPGPRLRALQEFFSGMVEHQAEVDGDLTLLAAAEAVRAKRRVRWGYWAYDQPPQLMAHRTCALIHGQLYTAQNRGEVRSDVSHVTMSGWLSALYWYELWLRGPHKDGRPTPRRPPPDSWTLFQDAVSARRCRA